MRRLRQSLLVMMGAMVLVAGQQPVHAQARIGYTDPDGLALYMQETKTMQQTLQTYRKKLQDDGAVKERRLQTLVSDYQAKMSVLSEERKAQTEKDLQELQLDLQKYVAESEQKLAQKQNELLQPILEKINKAITKVAKEKNLEIVLTQQAILYIDEAKVVNITREVATELGITFPEESQ